jgi:hypothetical protein
MTFRAGKRHASREGLRIPAPPRDIAGALRLASWCAIQVARGNISYADAPAITDALKEFRELLAARDTDAKLAEAKRLVAEMKTVRA